MAGKLTDPSQTQQALDAVLQAMQRTTDASGFQGLAQAVQALAGKLTDAQAQQALDAVLQAMQRTTDASPFWGATAVPAVQALQALVGKLTDASQAQQALDKILQAMPGTTDPIALKGLAQTVAGKLAGAQAQQALDVVLQVMRGATDANALVGSALAVQAAAGELTDAQAQQALDAVVQAMRGTTDANAHLGLAQAAQALADKLTDAQAQQALADRHLHSAFGWSATSKESAAWAEAIAALLRRPTERNYVGAIVELLKYPVAAGQATKVLLAALRVAIPAAPGAEAGLPANLRWIADTYPGIDLKSAPPCPPPLSRESLACPSGK